MIEYASVLARGGFAVWNYGKNVEAESMVDKVNYVLRTAVVRGRFGDGQFNRDGYTLQLELDNDLDLVYLVAHQQISQPGFVRDLLAAMKREFQAVYRHQTANNASLYLRCSQDQFRPMDGVFEALLQGFLSEKKRAPPKVMRTFEESDKSRKTVATLLEPTVPKAQTLFNQKASKIPQRISTDAGQQPTGAAQTASEPDAATPINNDEMNIMKMRQSFMKRLQTTKDKKPKPAAAASAVAKSKAKRVKENRCWDSGDQPADVQQLDFSAPVDADGRSEQEPLVTELNFVGMMKGELEGIKEDSSDDESVDESAENDPAVVQRISGRGFFAAFQSLVGSKVLSKESLAVPLEKMKEHLIGKNVAAEVAQKLCDSVAVKLEGRTVSQFSGIANVVKEAVKECLTQLLLPKHRVNMLRDVMHAKAEKRCYTVVLCGVNGVGKSTNLAKIAFWLNENGFRVLIAACDTFRAGAVEQLRTHVKHLSALHPGLVELYEKGYGKDAAGVASSAISHATNSAFDVVLVDTAGRMQDNEPLMRSLAKLIHVNCPDLVLFVGEALVGNEAIDQLQKFNNAFADHTSANQKVRLLDGIMLTKFDTIDDKVGAAISMTYITGKPIVFVGTGQTYADLKVLDSGVIVSALLK